MIDFSYLIERYGYAALIVGSIAEGETITILAGFISYQGLLNFPLAVASVALGAIIGDQLLYVLGRCFGYSLLDRLVRHKKKIEKVQQLIQYYPCMFVIATRFIYGFRIIGPILIGLSCLSGIIFLILNIIGSIIWALFFTSLGYLGANLFNK